MKMSCFKTTDGESIMRLNFAKTVTLLLGCAALCSGQSVWECRYPAADIFSMIYEDSQFVAVGDKGLILTSRDAIIWTMQNSGVRYSLRCVTYGNGKFLIAGDSSSFLTSSDGIAWKTTFWDTTYKVSSVAYGNGLFVTVGRIRHSIFYT
jgi:photosystem II stability/assembly factor-like uncharacterized protein